MSNQLRGKKGVHVVDHPDGHTMIGEWAMVDYASRDLKLPDVNKALKDGTLKEGEPTVQRSTYSKFPSRTKYFQLLHISAICLTIPTMVVLDYVFPDLGRAVDPDQVRPQIKHWFNNVIEKAYDAKVVEDKIKSRYSNERAALAREIDKYKQARKSLERERSEVLKDKSRLRDKVVKAVKEDRVVDKSILDDEELWDHLPEVTNRVE
ncbi:uncharacterized protein HMPREF1541_10094 [Cyphellophora europaea CBS 101466]|uniref:Uncharacterized protein n=1 Tax=Cyphellophora europaea (strain CBS 101466) TaxID=1220924 RepID=W2S966_CYPE1|nr:uncharacterized protein HMPREF1541_10094 [Cyphellophora europaea CBS 101466]ETN45217.1 hypothetical protein HMPREF1541_10094 [Cyphellophora europaea CBS 101466]